MMAFASLENIIPKILKNVNFEEYLLANKYSLLPNRNIKGFKCYSKKSDILGDDVVFVGNHKKEEKREEKNAKNNTKDIDFDDDDEFPF